MPESQNRYASSVSRLRVSILLVHLLHQGVFFLENEVKLSVWKLPKWGRMVLNAAGWVLKCINK